ncbi:MAG: ABC transporter substrate-binding protein [Candidatus Pacebacteria bacterium]|nr:ABC transporter substrate-binding protein [Candidatus Paceibacterota bacterium]
MPKRKKPLQSKQKNNFPRIIVGFLFLFLMGFGGYYLFSKFQKPQELEKVKVSLVWLHQAQFAGIYAAIEKGFYEDEGLLIDVEEFKQGSKLGEDLANGKVDFSFFHAINLLEEVNKGHDLKAVAAIYQTSPYAFIFSQLNAMGGPNDFKNKTLGIKGESQSGVMLYSALLADLGLEKSDVKIVTTNFDTTEFEDIQSGVVDMMTLYRTDQVYPFKKNNLPYKLILPENFRFHMYGDVIATSGEMVKNNPQLVKKFVKATLKGWDYVIKNQEEAIDITDKYITSEDYKDKDYSRFILEESIPLIRSEKEFQIGEMELSKWNRVYEVMLDNNFIQNEFNVNDIFTNQFID